MLNDEVRQVNGQNREMVSRVRGDGLLRALRRREVEDRRALAGAEASQRE